MHEASIAAPLLRLVLEENERQTALMGRELTVRSVLVRSGLLQDLEARTLAGIFSLMAEGTAAEGAQLRMESEPMLGRCPDCNHEVRITRRDFHCPDCGGERVDWQGGGELYIASITVSPKE